MYPKHMFYKYKKPLPTIKKIIKKYIDTSKYQVFLFGSRAVGNHRPNSDYDIGILGKQALDPMIIFRLQGEFRETPYIVDIVDFFTVPKYFKKTAMKKIKILF